MTGAVERRRRRARDFAAVGHLLPDVLDELRYHVAEPADEAAQR